MEIRGKPKADKGRWEGEIYWILLLIRLQRIDQHTASGKDVFATAAADGGGDTTLGKIVAQPFHLLLVGTREVLIDPCMETNEVDTAIQTL